MIDSLLENEPAFAACERHMLETIFSEILDRKLEITWDDIGIYKERNIYLIVKSWFGRSQRISERNDYSSFETSRFVYCKWILKKRAHLPGIENSS